MSGNPEAEDPDADSDLTRWRAAESPAARRDPAVLAQTCLRQRKTAILSDDCFSLAEISGILRASPSVCPSVIKPLTYWMPLLLRPFRCVSQYAEKGGVFPGRSDYLWETVNSE